MGRAACGILGLVTKPLAGALDALSLVGEAFLFLGYSITTAVRQAQGGLQRLGDNYANGTIQRSKRHTS